MLSHRLADHRGRSAEARNPRLPRNTKPPKLSLGRIPQGVHDTMEKKDLLGVRNRAPAKRRRKLAAPAKASGNGGARGLAKAIAAYLASDSYMYAPLVSAPPTPPPPSPAAAAAPPVSTPEKEVTLVQKYRGSWQATFTVN